MAKIAFILLCHKDPDAIIAQAERLTAVGDVLAIHFDASAPAADYSKIRSALGDNPNVAFAEKRVRCGWGEWSLVQATLNAVTAAVNTFPRATHFYMLSGDCMAIKTAEHAHRVLDENDRDYIECYDFFESDWIKTGFKEERLIYRHVFNERDNKALFYASFNLQKKIGLTRPIPKDMRIMIGSQWWCLRRQTIEALLEFTRKRRDIVRFFKTTWIPDETYFQTIVPHLIPKNEIECRTLTFLMFSDYGMPVTFYDDQYDLLISQDFLFARKISPQATKLRKRLGSLYSETGVEFAVSNEGQSLFKFLTGRGRIGQRFQPRIWEQGAKIGRDKTVLILTCKKWHVAKRFVDRVKTVTSAPVFEGIFQEHDIGLSALEYIFNEYDAGLPSLGGIENSLEKRNRHRRALIRMAFDALKTESLLFCLDPSDFAAIQDFHLDSAKFRILEIECEFSDDYLLGHAKRVGLAGEMTPQKTIDRLIPTIRNEISWESNRIKDANFENSFRIRETANHRDNAMAVAQFLGLSVEQAHDIVTTDHLFSD